MQLRCENPKKQDIPIYRSEIIYLLKDEKDGGQRKNPFNGSPLDGGGAVGCRPKRGILPKDSVMLPHNLICLNQLRPIYPWLPNDRVKTGQNLLYIWNFKILLSSLKGLKSAHIISTFISKQKNFQKVRSINLTNVLHSLALNSSVFENDGHSTIV